MGTDYVLVPSATLPIHVRRGYEPGVGHYDEVSQVEPLDEVVEYRYNRVAFVLASVEDGVRQQISAFAGELAEDYL